MCCICNGSCCHTGPHWYCAAHQHWYCAAPSNPWLTWTWTVPRCEHCYCEQAIYPDEHLKCCKCANVMHRKFVDGANS